MSAVQGRFMNENREPEENEEGEDSHATFWQWFALAVLLLAWIAEATMCADRGF